MFGNLKPYDSLVDTVTACLRSGKHNGYIHSAGHPDARAAIAKRYSLDGRTPLTADVCSFAGPCPAALSAPRLRRPFSRLFQHVVIASGCSGAIDLAINVLGNPGDTCIVARPAFALYQTIAESRGMVVKTYDLLPGAPLRLAFWPWGASSLTGTRNSRTSPCRKGLGSGLGAAGRRHRRQNKVYCGHEPVKPVRQCVQQGTLGGHFGCR